MYVDNYITCKGPYMDYETPKRSGVGLFLSNFFGLRKPSPLCYAVWCVEFYRPHPEDPFRVQESLAAGDNESENLETEERLNKRFRIARYGYHLRHDPDQDFLFALILWYVAKTIFRS